MDYDESLLLLAFGFFEKKGEVKGGGLFCKRIQSIPIYSSRNKNKVLV